jgi:hypothetical protein
MVRYMRHYPLQGFISHKFGLRNVDAAVQKSIEPESMKVVIDPWDV